MGDRDRGRMALITIGFVVAALVAVAVVIALQPPPVLDPTTPEGTAQGYFQALHDGDEDLALSYLTDDLVERCEEFSYTDAFRWYGESQSADVVIIDTDTQGSDAEVDVAITVMYGESPFDASSDRFEETLVMVRHGDRWLISEPPWPLDRHFCEREG